METNNSSTAETKVEKDMDNEKWSSENMEKEQRNRSRSPIEKNNKSNRSRESSTNRNSRQAKNNRSRSPRGRRTRAPTNRRIYVANIPYDCKWTTIKDLFREKVGDVSYVELFEDENGKFRGCGILEFKESSSVPKAVDLLHRYEFRGRQLVVKEDFDVDRDKTGKPLGRNRGGGGGGSGGGGMNLDRDRNDYGGLGGLGNLGNNNAPQYNTYGLSPQFLESLGINGPLSSRVFVANLDYKVVTPQKLEEVFKLAGRVVKIDLKRDEEGNSKGHGTIEMGHPVEAVQAISMFNGQKFYNRTMSVRMDKKHKDDPEDKRLPEGLQSVGKGLGANGLPLHLSNIRQQLNEQLKCLDVRVETQVSLVAEIQDYFRRRAEVELEYSKSLEKLAKGLLLRHKAEKQKREQWHLFSSYACWQHLVSTTRRQSRDHAAISEIYANTVINRMNCIMEDVQRIYRRCREVGIEIHDELLKVLHELHTTMKTYYTYHTEEKQAEGKLNYVEAQKSKLEQSIPKEKLQRSKKFRLMEKEIQKRRLKYNDAKLKALKARNDYLLCMDASNAAIHKYFVDDLSDIIDCMDFGFHTSIAHTLMISINAEECLKKSQQASIDGMNKCITNLDSRVDKQRFLEYNNSAFMVPKKFEFQPHKGDEVTQISVEKPIQDELEQRFKLVNNRLTQLKTESEEIWKTLETAEKTLLEMLSTKDFDCAILFDEDGANRNGLKQPETVALKRRADKQETEDFYLNKFSEYIMTNNLIARLQAKSDLIRRGLDIEGEDISVLPGGASPHIATRPHNLPQRLRKKRIGRTPLVGQPKLFGGSLEEYLEATNQEIPLIIRSCIRVINLYGLHHQGIFRVSGSQVEINNFRETFERGEDPLADVSDASDINSVGGVLKLYLRELREPLFPIFYFDQLVDISQVESKKEFIQRVKDVVNNLPRSVVVVLRYLFAFLNHLSEFSDENMMDPYNLAICFGPTLLPIPEDKDQVQYQNLVNELIKNIIIYQEEIFPDDGGIVYEKYISTNVPDENDVGDSPPDPVSDLTDDSEADTIQSEDDAVFPEQEIAFNLFGKTEVMEAVAQFDFNARSQRELSFKKGDTLMLHNQVSNDWWKGSFLGKEGLIPDKYILLKIRDEDKDKSSIDGSEKRRTSSSSDSLSGNSHSPKSLSTSGVPEDCSSTSSLDRRSLNSLHPQTPEWEISQPFLVRSREMVENINHSIANEKSPLPEPPDLETAYDIEREAALVEAHNIEDIDRRPKKACKDAPDLVLDLPINLPSPVSGCKGGKNSPEDNLLSPASSTDSPELTTAERFAKSNQCTMKKGTMSRSASHVTGPQSLDAQTQTFYAVRRSASTGDNLGPASPELALDSKEKVPAQQTAPCEKISPPQIFNSSGVKVETVELSWNKDKTLNDVQTNLGDMQPVPEKIEPVSGGGISSFKPPIKSKPPPVMKKPNRAEIKAQEVYQQTAC